jgi:hypothetical protein
MIPPETLGWARSVGEGTRVGKMGSAELNSAVLKTDEGWQARINADLRRARKRQDCANIAQRQTRACYCSKQGPSEKSIGHRSEL